MDYSDLRIIIKDITPERGVGILGWTLWVLSLSITVVIAVVGCGWVLLRAGWLAARGARGGARAGGAQAGVGAPPSRQGEAQAGGWSYAPRT